MPIILSISNYIITGLAFIKINAKCFVIKRYTEEEKCEI